MDSGVYLLRSLRCPGLIYVGSTNNLSLRKSMHFASLKRHDGENIKLLDHIDQYGINDLRFYIIERCPIDRIRERELYWNRKLMPELNVKHIFNENVEKLKDAKLLAMSDMHKEFLKNKRYLVDSEVLT